MQPTKLEIEDVLKELAEATYEFSRASQKKTKATLEETASRTRMMLARSAMRDLQNDLVVYAK